MITERQKEVLRAVAVATLRGEWYRAAHPGQRVTLASLYRHQAIVRRARRGVEGAADAAYEYQLSDAALAQLKSVAP